MRWTQSEVDFLEDNRSCSNKFLADRLGRSVHAISTKKYELKLRSFVEPAVPEPLTQYEKEMRIIKLAADMRIKLKGWHEA